MLWVTCLRKCQASCLWCPFLFYPFTQFQVASSQKSAISFRFADLGLDRWLSFACQVPFYSLLLSVDITTSSSSHVWHRKRVFSVLMQRTILIIFSLSLLFRYMYVVVWHCHFWGLFYWYFCRKKNSSVFEYFNFPICHKRLMK